MNRNQCQLFSLPRISEPLSFSSKLWQARNRMKRIIKRRKNYALNYLQSISASSINVPIENSKEAVGVQPGDLVRVRSKKEIYDTLDQWNRCRGCDIMEEMEPYFGTEQKVFKRVEKFLDERDYKIKKCSGIVILDGVLCEGTNDYGPCDRSCFYFWREEWLEKISA